MRPSRNLIPIVRVEWRSEERRDGRKVEKNKGEESAIKVPEKVTQVCRSPECQFQSGGILPSIQGRPELTRTLVSIAIFCSSCACAKVAIDQSGGNPGLAMHRSPKVLIFAFLDSQQPPSQCKNRGIQNIGG